MSRSSPVNVSALVKLQQSSTLAVEKDYTKPNRSQITTIYDIETTDPEDDVTKNLNQDTQRKRRRLNSTTAQHELPWVHDDDSMQRHIAAEVGQLVNTIRHKDKDIARLHCAREMSGVAKARATIKDEGSNCHSHRAKAPMQGPKSHINLVKSDDKSNDTSGYRRNQRSSPVPDLRVASTTATDETGMTVTAPTAAPSVRVAGADDSIPRETSQVQVPLTMQKIQGSAPVRCVKLPERHELSGYENDRKYVMAPSRNAVHGTRRKSAPQVVYTPRRRRLIDKLHRDDGVEENSGEVKDSDLGTCRDGNRPHKSRSSSPQTVNVTPSSCNVNIHDEIDSAQQDKGLGATLPIPKLQINSHETTYASRRSYITNQDIDAPDTSRTLPSDETEASTRLLLKNVPDLRQGSECPRSLVDDMYDRDIQTVASIKSVHELREAGENTRRVGDVRSVLDEIDIFDEMTLTMKRNSLLSIATKLQDPKFCHRSVDNGLDQRLVVIYHGSTDLVAIFLILAALLCILKGSHLPHTLTHLGTSTFIDAFSRQLGHKEDILSLIKERKVNMSRVNQSDVGKFVTMLQHSSVWSAGKPQVVTARTLSLQCLEHTVHCLRDAGSTDDILPQRTVEAMLDVLVLPQSISSSSPNLDAVIDVRLALSTLESNTIRANAETGELGSWSHETVHKFALLIPALELNIRDRFREFRPLILRLCLNLTNGTPGFCNAFSTKNFIHATLRVVFSNFSTVAAEAKKDEQAQLLDDLILSLGLLINLAEWDPEARSIFLLPFNESMNSLEHLLAIFMANKGHLSEV